MLAPEERASNFGLSLPLSRRPHQKDCLSQNFTLDQTNGCKSVRGFVFASGRPGSSTESAPQERAGPRRAAQGRYMTMSEVKGNFRNSILIPEIGWENFRDVLDDYVKQVKEGD